MWARVKEFDGDDDRYEGMIERIAQETDAANLNDAVLSNVDKNHTPEDGETETAAQDAVDELNKIPVAEKDRLDPLHKDHTAEDDEIDTLFYELQR